MGEGQGEGESSHRPHPLFALLPFSGEGEMKILGDTPKTPTEGQAPLYSPGNPVSVTTEDYTGSVPVLQEVLTSPRSPPSQGGDF